MMCRMSVLIQSERFFIKCAIFAFTLFMLPPVGFAEETNGWKYSPSPGAGTFNTLGDAEAVLRAVAPKFAPLVNKGATYLSDTAVRFSYEAKPRLVGASLADWVYSSC